MNKEKIIEFLKRVATYLRPASRVPALETIDFPALIKAGKKNIILDLDETLIPKRVNDITPSIYSFISRLKFEGFKICLTSNNRHPLRVEYLAKTLGLPHVSLAFKPFPFAFRRALKLLAAAPDETVVIGDQLLTDILGGNLLGLYTILVDPITKTESLPMQMVRWFEKKISEFSSKYAGPF